MHEFSWCCSRVLAEFKSVAAVSDRRFPRALSLPGYAEVECRRKFRECGTKEATMDELAAL